MDVNGRRFTTNEHYNAQALLPGFSSTRQAAAPADGRVFRPEQFGEAADSFMHGLRGSAPTRVADNSRVEARVVPRVELAEYRVGEYAGVERKTLAKPVDSNPSSKQGSFHSRFSSEASRKVAQEESVERFFRSYERRNPIDDVVQSLMSEYRQQKSDARKSSSNSTSTLNLINSESRANKHDSFGNRAMGAAVDITTSLITLGSSAHANPIALSGGLFSPAAAAPGVVSTRASNSAPLTFSRLGNELSTLGYKIALFGSVMTNPSLAQETANVLVTPMHERNREDTIFAGGGGRAVEVDGTVPPYSGHEIDKRNVLPGKSLGGDGVDSEPFVTYHYDGERAYTMFREKRHMRRYECSNGLVYEDAAYHGVNDNSVKNKAPTNPKIALENSKIYKEKGNHQRRLAYDLVNGEIVVFDGSTRSEFHGHVRSWDELDNSQKAFMQKEFNFAPKGKYRNTEG